VSKYEYEEEIDSQIYIVAVDVNPVFWAVDCEICEGLVTEGTINAEEVYRVELSHKASHLGLSAEAYFRNRRRGRKALKVDPPRRTGGS
jgi:hypothetical protein